MKIQIKKINLTKLFYIIFFALMMLFAFYPSYFNEIPIIDKIDIFINIALVYFIILGILKRHTANYIFLYILFYSAIAISATIMNHGNIENAIWGNGILLIILIGGMHEGYKLNAALFEKITYILMYVLITINLITVFLFPEGLMTDDRGIQNTNFFLGNYNSYIQYLIMAMLYGYLYHARKKQKVSAGWYCIYVIGFLFYSQKFSVTSSFGLGLILVYHIFFNTRWTRLFLNLKIYTIFNIIFFGLFVWSPGNSKILIPVLGMLQKDFTFTGRTTIWMAVKEIIRSSSYLGIGLQSGETMTQKIGLTHAVHAHNLYLNILLTLGIGGMLLFIIIFLHTAYRISLIKDKKVRYFMENVLGILMFMSQFEAYSMKFVFSIMTLFCLYAEQERAPVGGNVGENKGNYL